MQLTAGHEVEYDGIERASDRWEVFWARVFQAVGRAYEVDECRDLGCGHDQLGFHAEASPVSRHSATDYLERAEPTVGP